MSAIGNIGQYRILRKIGAGGMGTIYLGEHILLGRRAAIKTLLPSLAMHPEIVERFFNEARATSQITDAGVVQVFDFGYHVDGTAYIVMELLEGEPLSERLDRLGTLHLGSALRIARQVAASLASAHAHAIVHRDLKPENVFLIADHEAEGGERTKLLDFGICKLGDDTDSTHTLTGTTLGTPAYMSPEQCRGVGGVDHRADIYALGCVLFHMLTGRAPFDHQGAGEFIVSHLHEVPPAPSTFVASLPPSLDALLARCLAKAPEDRFQSMFELEDALEEELSHVDLSTIELVAPPTVIPSESAVSRRRSSQRRSPLGTVRARPSPAKPPMPTTLGTANGESELAPAPRRGLGATLAIVVTGALVTALVVLLSHVVSPEEASAKVVPAAATFTTAAPPIASAAPVVAAPAPATAPLVVAVAPLGTVEHAPRPVVVAEANTRALPIPRDQTTRPSRRPAASRPARRAPPPHVASTVSALAAIAVPAPAPIAVAAPVPMPVPVVEDLYDTR